MISDQDLAQALPLWSLSFAKPSLHDVVQQLQSKLGLGLSHKVDLIRNHIHFLFRPPPPRQLPHHHHSPPPQQQQSPNFHPTPSFTLHHPEEFPFRPQRSAPPHATYIEAYTPNITSTTITDVAATAADQPAAERPKQRIL